MDMAAETGPSHPTNRKLGVVILGASTYPHFPPTRNLDNESFARSATAFRSLMADERATVFGKPGILDLFDVDDDFASVLRRVIAFLKNEPAVTDIVFYYCGHGSFLVDRTYYLTLKATEFGNEAFTGLPLRQMRLALDTELMGKRVFLVFDCCFSGQAAKEWMSGGIGHVIEDQVFQTFPKRGTALIAASARSGPAIAPEGESLTMFTGAFINTVSKGLAGEKRELSFRDIVDAVRARISDRYGSSGVTPEIHAPQQEEGDITFTPFFANRAFVAPPETKAEREYFELAVGNLDHPFSVTRRGAVEALEELLSRTRSAAFRKEILNKLRDVKEKDDSQRVRTKCEEILTRWPAPSDGRSGAGEGESGEPVMTPEPAVAAEPVVSSKLPVLNPPVAPRIVDPLITAPGPGISLGQSGSGGSIEVAIRIDTTKAFLRSSIPSIASLSLWLMMASTPNHFSYSAKDAVPRTLVTLGFLLALPAIYYFTRMESRSTFHMIVMALSFISGYVCGMILLVSFY